MPDNSSEKASVEELFQNPKHPYTRSLLRSNPSAETVSDDLYVIPGSVPSLSEIEYDQRFISRSSALDERRAQKVISEKMTEISSNHFVRGQAWKKFEFPDQKLKGGKSERNS